MNECSFTWQVRPLIGSQIAARPAVLDAGPALAAFQYRHRRRWRSDTSLLLLLLCPCKSSRRRTV